MIRTNPTGMPTTRGNRSETAKTPATPSSTHRSLRSSSLSEPGMNTPRSAEVIPHTVRNEPQARREAAGLASFVAIPAAPPNASPATAAQKNGFAVQTS